MICSTFRTLKVKNTFRTTTSKSPYKVIKVPNLNNFDKLKDDTQLHTATAYHLLCYHECTLPFVLIMECYE